MLDLNEVIESEETKIKNYHNIINKYKDNPTYKATVDLYTKVTEESETLVGWLKEYRELKNK